jgi:hypothetical protein
MMSMVLTLANIYRSLRFERTPATELRLLGGALLHADKPLTLRVQLALEQQQPASRPIAASA